MTWHEMGIEMIRIFSPTKESRNAHVNLIKSPFAKSIRGVWLEVYNEGVRTGRVTHIELLPKEAKKELWESTKEICKEYELTDSQLIQVARALFTLETYLNENMHQMPQGETGGPIPEENLHGGAGKHL